MEVKGGQDELNFFYYENYEHNRVTIMHNLISFNQLVGTRDSDPHNDLITEYYECLVECDENQAECKRICKEVLIR